MKNKLCTAALLGMSLLTAPTMYATSLEDAMNEIPENGMAPKFESLASCICSNRIRCDITHLDLTRELNLPNAGLFTQNTYIASKGCVFVVVRGIANNQDTQNRTLYIMGLVSGKGNEYESVTSLSYSNDKGSIYGDSDMAPGGWYRFIKFYQVPIREVMGSKMKISGGFFAGTKHFTLPISSSQKIEEELTITGAN